MVHCNDDPIYVFPEKELRDLSPNFNIHVSVSDLYIPRIGLPSAAGKYVDRWWEYINRSQAHECGNWDWGCAIPFLGIFVADVGIMSLVPSNLLISSGGINFVTPTANFWIHLLGSLHKISKNFKSKVSFKYFSLFMLFYAKKWFT